MPRKDIYHETVKTALEKDGWTITADPMYLEWNDAVYYPDLGAERVIAASKGLEKIAVEIKTFIGQVLQDEFYKALGQFDNYYFALADLEPDRTLILAIPNEAYEDFFQKAYVQKVIEMKKISLLVYNINSSSIEKWIR
jgi:hypothetical protein